MMLCMCASAPHVLAAWQYQTVPTMPPPSLSPTITPTNSPTYPRTATPTIQPDLTPGTTRTTTPTLRTSITPTYPNHPTSTGFRLTPTIPQATSIPPTQTAEAMASETLAAAMGTATYLPAQTMTMPAQVTKETTSQAANGTDVRMPNPTQQLSNSEGTFLGLYGLIGGVVVLVAVIFIVIWRGRGQKPGKDQSNDD